MAVRKSIGEGGTVRLKVTTQIMSTQLKADLLQPDASIHITNAVFLQTVLSAKLDWIRVTPGKPERCCLWIRS